MNTASNHFSQGLGGKVEGSASPVVQTGEEPPMTPEDKDLLRQCIASGQVSARQIDAHREAGEYEPASSPHVEIDEKVLEAACRATREAHIRLAQPQSFTVYTPWDDMPEDVCVIWRTAIAEGIRAYLAALNRRAEAPMGVGGELSSAFQCISDAITRYGNAKRDTGMAVKERIALTAAILSVIRQEVLRYKSAAQQDPVAVVINNNQPGNTTIVEVVKIPPTLDIGTKLYAVLPPPPDIAALQARVKVLEGELRWYADKANWTEPNQVNAQELFDTPMGADLGNRARAALTDAKTGE